MICQCSWRRAWVATCIIFFILSRAPNWRKHTHTTHTPTLNKNHNVVLNYAIYYVEWRECSLFFALPGRVPAVSIEKLGFLARIALERTHLLIESLLWNAYLSWNSIFVALQLNQRPFLSVLTGCLWRVHHILQSCVGEDCVKGLEARYRIALNLEP